MTPKEELKTINDAIALATARKAELENELEEHNDQEGTPGYLWNTDFDCRVLVNLIYTGIWHYPYSGTGIGDGFRHGAYRNFTPLETCIMGMRYENTGVYPGHEKDLVVVGFGDGSESCQNAGYYTFNLRSCPSDIKYHYIIKRFEE